MKEQEAIRAKPGDLEEGNIFDGNELILGVREDTMTTLRQESKFGEDYEMEVVYYDLIRGGDLVEVRINGGDEISKDNSQYQKFKQRLEGAGIWENL